MGEPSKIKLQVLAEVFEPNRIGFLCCASFETRTLCIPEKIAINGNVVPCVFRLSDGDDIVRDNASKMSGYFGSGDDCVMSVEPHSPFSWSKIISDALVKIAGANVSRVVVDTTTFTHESLLILLRLLYDKRAVLPKIICLYLGASEYSSNETAYEMKWLSKGCRDLRTVLGYPGWMKPGSPTCLTVLVGFEHERATRMIAMMEPEKLFLGTGLSDDANLTHANHRAAMLHFQALVKDMMSTRFAVHDFKFSCSEPLRTMDALNDIVRENGSCNHIVVPLNTKLSTIAAGLVALKNKNVQICYAEPETYNRSNYSVPGENVTMWDLDFES